MPSCLAVRVVLGGLLISLGQAHAEQRFYQVVDPDGHIRIIKQQDGAPANGKQAAPPSSPAGDPAPSVTVPSSSQPPSADASAKAPMKPALYDGDGYMDSEDLEGSGFNPEQKKHFFIINDGAGNRIEDRSPDNEGLPVTSDASSRPEEQEKGYPLPDEYAEDVLPASLDGRIAGLKNGCFAADVRKHVDRLAQGRYSSLLIDRRSLAFAGPAGVLQGYKLNGLGIRNLTVVSYAKKEDAPAYSRPLIVFSDANGCSLRVVESYFQMQYPATKTRHAMLQGKITIHADDAYVFIVAPDAARRTQSLSNRYTLSEYGQISLKWQP
jgi:hypothetical protein